MGCGRPVVRHLNSIPHHLSLSLSQFVPEGNTPYVSAKTFEDLGLSQELLKGLYSEMRFERPSKIQAETLPMILTPPFRNLVAQARARGYTNGSRMAHGLGRKPLLRRAPTVFSALCC